MAIEGYTLEQAEEEIAELRGLVDRMSEIITIGSANLIAYTGRINTTSGQDTNTYDVQRLTLPATGQLTLTTSMVTVPGLSAALGLGTYHFRAQLLINPVSAGGAISYRTHATNGLVQSSGRCSIVELFPGAPVLTDYALLDVTLTGSAPGSGNSRITTFDGIMTVSTPGTLNIQVSQAAAANGNTLQVGTYLEIFPVS